MSLIFYRANMSTATITDLVIEELGVPCERVTLDIRKGDTKKPEYLKLNPNGKVPTIVHDGVVIWESAAITIYLGELFGVEKGLFPAPGTERGVATKWIVWANVTLGEAAGRWARNAGEWGPADEKNAKAGETAKNDLFACLRILDEALQNSQFLLGSYSLADTHVNSMVDWLRYMKLDLSSLNNVEAWGARCAARPAYAKVMSGGA